jgi:hypothetical protein
MVQVLEFNLVTYAQWIRRGHAGRPLSAEEFEKLRERLLHQTFGQTTGEVNDLLEKRWVLGTEMKAMLDLRNELVHHWMRERVEGFNTSESRLAMVSEIDEAIEQLRGMADIVINRTKGFMARAGISHEEILAEVRRIEGQEPADADQLPDPPETE